MKTKFLAPALIAATLAGAASTPVVATPPVFPVNPQLQLQPLQPLPPLVLCPDLGVQVRFEPGGGQGMIRTVIRLTNHGPTNYNSSAGLQRVSVRATNGWAEPEIQHFNFTSLAHGASREWSFVRPMNGAPIGIDAYLRISPAVYSDANPFNNECNNGNNTVHTQT